MYKIKQLILKIILGFGSLFKIKDIIILESVPDFTDNSKALYDYFIKNKLNEKYKIIWFTDKTCTYKTNEKNVYIVEVWKKFRTLSFVGVFKYFHYLKNAKYIMFCNRGIHRLNKKSHYIFLNHGLPLKNVRNLKIVNPNVDYALCPSEFFKDVYVDQLHLPKEKILTLGSPRNDIMFNYKKKDYHFSFINKNVNKIILWLPTFRDNVNSLRNDSEFNFPLGIPIIYNEEDLIKVDKYLKKEKAMLLLKPHPVQDLSKIKNINLNNIKLITDKDLQDNNINLNEFLYYVDAFLTDYSGIYYDMLLTNKQIGFTLDDFDEYNKKRGFPFDNPQDKMAGMKIYNIEDLLKYFNCVINNIDEYKKDRDEKVHLFYKDLDGKACERIVKYFDIK